MKNYTFLFLSIFLFDFAYSQDSSDTKQKEIKHGIQFQIIDFLELRNFDGYTLSYRYCINRKSGLRLGFLMNMNESTSEITQQVDSITGNPPNYGSDYGFELSGQYLHSLLNYSGFDLILGGGPFFLYRKGNSNSENIQTDYTRKYKSKSETVGFGLDLILGVEYKLVENVILSGEYGIKISKDNSEIEYIQSYIFNDGNPNRFYRENGERDAFSISGSGVNLGIAVFF